MKRAFRALLGAVGISLVMVMAGQGTGIAEAAKKKQKEAAKPAAPAVQEKVVHTFEDEAKMQEFAGLWQQRQGILLRLGVLQAYANQEQAALTQINEALVKEYNLEASKNYSLDTERKALVEREAPAADGGSPQPSAQ